MRNFVTWCVVLLAMAGNASSEEPKQPPKELTVDLGKGTQLEMVLIPAGEFLMGSPDSDKDASGDEKPQHRVRITRPFYLGKHLVTQEQWEAVMGNNPSDFQGPKNPVEQVSWDDCRQFLDKLNKLQGNQAGNFQLPTEAQWEYACRAGSTTRYCFGDEESGLGEYAWYGANSGTPASTHPVGGKKPNAWGLYDVHGNAWEWCADWHDGGYYAGSPTDDPTGPATGSNRVARGGSWSYPAGDCRSALRYSFAPGRWQHNLGLRVAQAPAERVVAAPLPKSPGPPKIQPTSPQTVTVARPGPSEAKEIAVDLGGGAKLEMVLIPAGEFLMGSPDSDQYARDHDKPQHRVRITRPLYLGKYLVTQEQWEAVMGGNPSWFKGPKHPVENISWDDCQRFLDKLNGRQGNQAEKFQLPSEAQWEYACRAGSKTRYCFGDEESGLGEYAWYSDNSGGKTHPVGEKKPNAWGLYDVHGNVWEFCSDWYDGGYYRASPADDPTGPARGLFRSARGGGWLNTARACRSADRQQNVASIGDSQVGFRVARQSLTEHK